ncbi:MAG: Slp family lipoprotein [Gammaproteobacteria bacterium]|nr:Slp family lipoprotein [Gammaproteobacteria bacterium]
MMHPVALLLLLAALLPGCAASIPAALREAPAQSPSLEQVRTQPESYPEVRLRWGGTIVMVENLPQTTRIEIVARRLHASGEPVSEDSSAGRFIAHFDQFLDPTIYASGRALTVVGRFVRLEQRELDKMRYRYPLVRVESHHLWPEPEPLHHYYDPYWHDPFFYDPWYPFGYPYPYYYYPYRYPRPHAR